MAEKEYVLGTDAAEMQRLGLQHRLWSDAAHRLWKRAGLRPGLRVLDVGCGPGFAAFDMAQIAGPTGAVFGVDESAPYVEHANAQARSRGLPWFRAVRGDVQDLGAALAAGAERAGTFDMAYSRWVLCFVPDPERVIAGIASALRPGGRVAIQDYFNYEALAIAPKHAAFTRVIDGVAKSWRSHGGDPDVVGRLPGLMRRHGLTVEHLDVNARVARPGSTMWAWPDTFFRTFLPRLESMGFISTAEQRDFLELWEQASDDPDAFILLPPVFDVVAIKG